MPHQGAIALSAHPSGREYVTLRNVSGAAVDLQDYRPRDPRRTATPSAADAVLAPGEAMTLDVRGDPAQGLPAPQVLGARRARSSTTAATRCASPRFRGVVIGCYAYGTASC